MTPIPLSGFVLVRKPPGPTSRAVVNLLQRRLPTRRVGHSGTLDPFAEGLLMVLWGRATGLVPYLHEYPKEYRAVAEFGRETDTEDATGTVTRVADPGGITAGDVRAALGAFRGTIRQRPPMYSALKHEGRRLHELARAGMALELPERERTVHALRLESWEPPFAVLTIACESGTYVRSLVRDLGTGLGPGAHVVRLARTAIGPHRVEDALDAEQVAGVSDEAIARAARPLEAALPDWEAHALADEAARCAVVHGSWRDPEGLLSRAGRVRLCDAEGRLLALAEGGTPPRLLRVFAGPDEDEAR